MVHHLEIDKADLFHQIKHGQIKWGGNKKLKIYGTLHCKSGKRMKRENRVFFASEQEAMNHGYRPCGHCTRSKYRIWMNKHIN